MTDVETVVFQDKSWVRLTEYQKLQEETESLAKRIAELEYQLTHRNCIDCSNHSSKLRMRTLELEKENELLQQQIEQLQKINEEQRETLKKVRVALIQERTASIMNYGKGGVEMFDNMI